MADGMRLQMVSLLHLAEITEAGVEFQSPVDGARLLLTPEQSMGIQNRLGEQLHHVEQAQRSAMGACSYHFDVLHAAYKIGKTSTSQYLLFECLEVQSSMPLEFPVQKRSLLRSCLSRVSGLLL